MPDDSVLGEVRRWVNRHPDGDLWVCTGFLSAWGLARLAEMAPDRPVMLLTTKPWRSVSDKATERDRRAAVAFLNRPDVRVQMWWRRARRGLPARDQHVKAFIADPHGPAPAALTGSANLTRTGLTNNQELMVEASPDGVQQLLNKVDDMLADDHPCQKQRVIDRLNGVPHNPQQSTPPTRPPTPTATPNGQPASRQPSAPPKNRNSQPLSKADTEPVRQRVSAAELAQMIAEHNSGHTTWSNQGWMVTCPNPKHRDHSPSCRVTTVTDGRAYFRCQAHGCRAKGDVYQWVQLAGLANGFNGAHEYLTRHVNTDNRPRRAAANPTAAAAAPYSIRSAPYRFKGRDLSAEPDLATARTSTATRERPSREPAEPGASGLFSAIVNTVRQHRRR